MTRLLLFSRDVNLQQFLGPAITEITVLVESNVSFQQRCVTGKGSRSERSGSVQLPEEQANAHSNIAIHLRLSRRSRHEVTATPALVQRHPSHMNLLSFQRASEQNRIGGDPSHQTGSSTLLANNPVAGFRFARHANSFWSMPPVP